MSYAVDVLLVGMFALIGTVSWRVPALHLGAATLVSAAFFTLIQRKTRTADPYYAVPQMAAATLVQLGGILVAPALTLVFLNVLFVVFAFGALRLNERQAVIGWLASSVCLSLTVAVVWPSVGVPRTRLDLVLFAISYSSTLARCVYVGLQGNWLRLELQASNDRLLALTQRVDLMTRHDELTGLMNRRAITAHLEDHAALARRRMDILSVALLNIDLFKVINDRYGQAIGDRVLQACAALSMKAIRATDHAARYGGEEFLFLLTGTDLPEGHLAMERLRNMVAAHDWSELAPGLAVTVSIGVTTFQPAESMDELLVRATDALYEAKRAGRDRVVLAA